MQLDKSRNGTVRGEKAANKGQNEANTLNY